MKNTQLILVAKSERKKLLGSCWCTMENDIKMNLNEIELEVWNLI
jgi:hypothetical protein